MSPEYTSDKWVVRYARWVVRWRWLILVATVGAVAAAASGGRFLRFQNNYRYFFREDNPQLQAFEEMQNVYTKNDNILIVLESAEGKAFDPQVLAAVEWLTQESWQVPYSLRVDSITNYQHTYAEGDDLIVEDLVADALDRDAAYLQSRREIALAEPLLNKRLVSDNPRVTAVNITLEMPGVSPDELIAPVTKVREMARHVEENYPGVRTYLTGVAMLSNAFSENAKRDLATLVPIMYGVLLLFMVFMLRSVSGTFATLLVIAFSGATAMGLAGWLGIPLTPPSSSAPTIILTLAIADSVHILLSMFYFMRKGMEKGEALVESLRINFGPVFLTSFTSAIGFASMNFSDVRPFNDLGNITTMGIAAAYVYSVTFLPALIMVLPVRVRQTAEGKSYFMDRMGDFVVRNRKRLLWGSVGVVAALAAFVPRNEFNDQFVRYFDKEIEFRTDTDFTTENLTGIYQVEFSLNAGEANGISDPAYLQKVDEFARWWRTQDHVVHVNTFTDIMKRLNRTMHGDDPVYYELPESRELAAQYLLLYELSLPYGLDLNNQINVERSSTRFTVTLQEVSSKELRAIGAAGEKWLKENAPPHMFTHAVGTSLMFAHISDRNTKSMLWGTLLAFVLISLSLVFALRSMKLGALSLLPNLFPAVAAFGIWGLLVSQVNLALSVVAAVSLGIVVDDTVHFLSKYLRGRREQDLSAEDAVRYAFSSVGMALVVTSCVLVAGFLVLTFSPFDLNAGMGKLTAITLVAALALDLLFLPPLLIAIEPKKEKAPVAEPAPAL